MLTHFPTLCLKLGTPVTTTRSVTDFTLLHSRTIPPSRQPGNTWQQFIATSEAREHYRLSSLPLHSTSQVGVQSHSRSITERVTAESLQRASSAFIY